MSNGSRLTAEEARGKSKAAALSQVYQTIGNDASNGSRYSLVPAIVDEELINDLMHDEFKLTLIRIDGFSWHKIAW